MKDAQILIDGLQQIEQMSDPGSYERAIIDMKAIAGKVLASYNASDVPESGMRWVKASERLPAPFVQVIVKSLISGEAKVTQNMTHNTGWDIANDWRFEYINTVWLDESQSSEQEVL